jgi:hypothetical protein
MSISGLEKTLRLIGEEIDLTKTEFDAIASAYNAMGNWLSASNSETKQYNFSVYPQGSVKIGTVIKPLCKDDYDVDIVCLFQNNFSWLSRKQVKKIVGQRLMENEDYKRMLENERGRCWTLNFQASPKFHMDILPATPGGTGNEAINATKRDDAGNYSNLPTNPKGFANWFLSIAEAYQKPEFQIRESKEPVPTFQEKCPLQIAVQLIKRHRDKYFLDKPKKIAPASIIINTLMAKTYKGQYSLKEILTNCPVHWTEEIQGSYGNYYLENPSLAKENFMDKWNHDDKNAPHDLFDWYGALMRDIDHLVLADSPQSMAKILKEMFGEATVDKVLNANPNLLRQSNDDYGQRNPSATDTTAFAKCVPLSQPYYPDPNVQITVDAVAKNKNGETICSFENSSPFLPKNAELFFKANVHNNHSFAPIIYWQITNTGKEAGTDVRGGFENSNGPYNFERKEHTSYQGTHFVQAFVIRGNYCVAKSGLILINVGSTTLP